MPSAQDWITQLKLNIHPEGGYYRETFRSPHMVPLPGTGEQRSACTSIHYLLPAGHRSHLHSLRADELWHHQAGGPLRLYLLEKGQPLRHIDLGHAEGMVMTALAPAGAWIGAEPLPGTDYAMVACTMAPGWDLQDFTLAKAEMLVGQWPEEEAWIRKMCFG